MIKEKLQEDMKTAMRAKDKKTLTVIRMVLAEFKMLETSGQEDVTEKDYVKKAEAYHKKLKKSLESYVTDEQKQPIIEEMEVVERYLPKKATQAEHQAIIDACGEDDINKVRKAVMSELGESCDNVLLNRMIQELKK